MTMYTPMKNLGANLLFVFAAGGLWAVGYLVSPYLEPHLAAQDIIVLRKSMMVLALLAFIINLVTRAHALRWQFIHDLRSQLAIAAILVGIGFVVTPATETQLSSILYGVTSLVCVIWVGLGRTSDLDDSSH